MTPNPWLERTVLISWWLLPGAINARWNRFHRILESFGAGLPAVTQAWLTARPLFILAFALSSLGLLLHLAEVHPAGALWAAHVRHRRKRPALWLCLAAAIVTAGWTLAALFAPMMSCSLAEH